MFLALKYNVNSITHIKTIHIMNIKDFDLNLIRAFTALYKTRNVSAAANLIDITQPAMSNALRRLRLQCADPLFVRANSAMEPTSLAHELGGPLTDALNNIESCLMQSRDYDPLKSHETFRLLTSDVGGRVILPPLMEALSTAAPNVKIETIQIPHEEYANALRTNRAALAIGNISFLREGFHQRHLFQDKYLCIARQGNPKIKGSLTLETYLENDHVVSRAGSTDRLVSEILSKEHKHRRVKVTVAHYYGCAEIVTRSDLLATVPENAVRGLQGLQLLPLPFEMPTAEVRQFWHRSVHTHPANMWLRRLIATVLKP